MSDYWGDEGQPVCPILERSMILFLETRGIMVNVSSSIILFYPYVYDMVGLVW